MKKYKFLQGDIYWVDLSTSVGHEFQGKRPALIIQSSEKMRFSNLVTVLPFTSNMANKIADDILVKCSSANALYSDSVLKVHSFVSVDYSRLKKKMGTADVSTLTKVKKYIPKHFDL